MASSNDRARPRTRALLSQSARMTRIASSPRRPRPRNGIPRRKRNSSSCQPTRARAGARRKLLERCRLLGEVDHVQRREARSRCRAGRGSTGDPAERHERGVHPAVGVDALGPDEDVLRRPDRVEPELLGRLRHAPDAVGRRALAEVGQDDPQVHDPSVLRRRVRASRVSRLATADPDGRIHLVPIVFALSGDTLYTAVDAKPKRSRVLRRMENARARPDVAVLVDRYDEDWSLLWWVRLQGRARVLDDGDEAALSPSSPRSTSSTESCRPARPSSRSTSPSGMAGPRPSSRPHDSWA